MYEPPRLVSISAINSAYGAGPLTSGCAVAVATVAVLAGVLTVAAAIHNAVAAVNVAVGVNIVAGVNVFVGGYSPVGSLDPRVIHAEKSSRIAAGA